MYNKSNLKFLILILLFGWNRLLIGQTSFHATADTISQFTLIDSGEIATDVSKSTGCGWADYDNDSFLDLFVANSDQQNFLYHNNGDGTFTKIAAYPFDTDIGQSAGVSWGDYDNDGFLDLFVSNSSSSESNFLYHNDDGHSFTKITTGPIVNDLAASQSACWGDYDNDGFLDLFVANDGYNFLYHNNGDKSFTKVTTSIVVTEGGASSGCNWVDFNNDVRLDLFVVNLSTTENFLYRNEGNGNFAKITSGAIVTDKDNNTYGSSWADFDNDGYLDVLVCNENNTKRYRNNGDETFTQTIHDASDHSQGSSWGDYDNDGDPDIVITNYPLSGDGGNLFFYRNDGDEIFQQFTHSDIVSKGLVNSQGTCWGDYDNDGDLDLFVAIYTQGVSNFLLRNDLIENNSTNNWVEIRCIGNASAFGTKVRIKATINDSPVWQTQEISSQTGKYSQNSPEALFGLGEATVIDSIKIEWLSGTVSVYENYPANQIYTFEYLPILVSPENNSIINNATPTFTWREDVVPNFNFSSYKLEIATDFGLENQISGSPFKIEGSTYFHLQNALSDSVYYWQVSAIDEESFGFSSSIFKFLLDTNPPDAPINLLANGENPSPVLVDEQEFTITWENPWDLSGIRGYYYNLGTPPTDLDIEFETEFPYGEISSPENPQINIRAREEFGNNLFIWLEDNARNSNLNNYSLVNLRYYNSMRSSEVHILTPGYGDTLSQYIYVVSNVFDFPVTDYRLSYELNDQRVPNEIILPPDLMEERQQFIYLWKTEFAATDSVQKILLKLTVNNQFADSVQFYLDPAKPSALITNPLKNQYLHGQVQVKGIVTGSEYNVKIKSVQSDSIALATTQSIPEAWNTVSGEVLVADHDLYTLQTDSVADGNYEIIVSTRNEKGDTVRCSIPIIFDNTPPEIAKFDIPDTVSCVTRIQGSASDSNFKQLILKKQKIGERDTSIIDFFATRSFSTYWNTISLNEEYSLFLVAEDKGGLTTTADSFVYIDNPRFEHNLGLKKRQDEFTVYIPPHGFSEACAICLEQPLAGDSFYDPIGKITPTDLIVEICSELTTGTFVNKLSTLTIDYSNSDSVKAKQIDENKLGIYYYNKTNDQPWEFIGGTRTKDSTITTTIKKIGTYGLCSSENIITDIHAQKDFQLSFQPRVFSPMGGSYDVQTAISYNLSKPTDVNIKIYNGAGRLVRNLLKNEPMPPGSNVTHWDGRDEGGHICVSDLYIVALQAEGKTATKTVAIVNK